MDVLPVELWEQIIRRRGLRKRDWAALCRTSRACRIIAEPQLYEEVDLPWINITICFARSLAERPELGSFVRVLALKSYPSDTDPMGRVLPHILSFPKLHTLQLDGFHIDIAVETAIRALPCLQSVQFKECDIHWELFEILDEVGPRITLLDVEISTPVSQIGWTQFVHAERSLILRIPDSMAPPQLIDGIISCSIPSSATSTLTNLTLNTYYPDTVRLLKCFPQIRHLALPKFTSMDTIDDIAHLTGDVIPFLESYTGPPAAVGTFIRGRPVHTVDLYLRKKTPKDILSCLQHSSGPVTKLTLHQLYFDTNTVAPLLNHAPPTLRHFGWDFGFVHGLDMDTALGWLPSLSRLAQLRVLEGGVTDPKPTDWRVAQYCLVETMSKSCQSVQEFSFRLLGKYVREGVAHRWSLRRDGSWECYFQEVTMNNNCRPP